LSGRAGAAEFEDDFYSIVGGAEITILCG